MDDDHLMHLVSLGDARAFGVLVERHDSALLRYAFRLLGDRPSAEDAVQDSWLKLWRSRERYSPSGQLNAYLMRLVRNRCLDVLRSRRPGEELSEDLRSPDDPSATARVEALAEAVARAVAALPRAQRVVFALSVDEGLSYAEIAEVLGCPVGTVASRKYQAVETLRRKLSSWRDGGDE